ncbi:9081_t:CDS:2 [Gigaspora margarita]|uniref:9081_t:CDS:1 n=1 Tax=Gigaspora margarita TaxID=4874 RepID=A0ABM8VZ40_GIGMA|nr:9081_t:CDS:2 [Gigaspora margarita]
MRQTDKRRKIKEKKNKIRPDKENVNPSGSKSKEKEHSGKVAGKRIAEKNRKIESGKILKDCSRTIKAWLVSNIKLA